MTDKQVTKKEEPSVQTEHPHKTETITVPDVDIRESDEHIRLLADMPGVDRKFVGVTVENNVLTIEGQAHIDSPKGYELVGQEYGVGKYRRDFTLSNAVAVDGIKARMQHGVLEVTIPKREEQAKRKAITIEKE